MLKYKNSCLFPACDKEVFNQTLSVIDEFCFLGDLMFQLFFPDFMDFFKPQYMMVDGFPSHF